MGVQRHSRGSSGHFAEAPGAGEPGAGYVEAGAGQADRLRDGRRGPIGGGAGGTRENGPINAVQKEVAGGDMGMSAESTWNASGGKPRGVGRSPPPGKEVYMRPGPPKKGLKRFMSGEGEGAGNAKTGTVQGTVDAGAGARGPQ